MIVFSVVVWLVTLSKVGVSWRNRHDPLARAFWFALASLAVVVTLDQPPIYVWLGERSGRANISIPFTTSAGVSAGYWCQTFLRHALESTGPVAHARRRAGLALAMVAVVAVTYLPGAATRPNTHDSIHTPPQTVAELVMRLCLAAWGVYTLADITGLCVRFSRRAGARPLRWGMAVAATGAPLIATRLLVEYGPYAVWSWRHTGQAPWEHALIRVVNTGALAGFALVSLGLGLPALIRKLTGLAYWGQDLTRYRRLSPLWRAVRPAVPTLDVRVLALRGRLYRRVVEIQDGFFALHPYREAAHEQGLRARAARLEVDERTARAWVDAHAIRAAVARLEAGDRPGDVASQPADARTRLDDVGYLLLVSAVLRGDRPGLFRGRPRSGGRSRSGGRLRSAAGRGDVLAVQALERPRALDQVGDQPEALGGETVRP
jgi:hypothetical protein